RAYSAWSPKSVGPKRAALHRKSGRPTAASARVPSSTRLSPKAPSCRAAISAGWSKRNGGPNGALSSVSPFLLAARKQTVAGTDPRPRPLSWWPRRQFRKVYDIYVQPVDTNVVHLDRETARRWEDGLVNQRVLGGARRGRGAWNRDGGKHGLAGRCGKRGNQCSDSQIPRQEQSTEEIGPD